jgi:hypothetical protein
VVLKKEREYQMGVIKALSYSENPYFESRPKHQQSCAVSLLLPDFQGAMATAQATHQNNL